MSDGIDEPEMYHGYSVDDEDQPQSAGDSLTEGGLQEPLDEGYAAPDRWTAGQGFGSTSAEEQRGDSWAARLAQEDPDPDPYEVVETVEDDVSPYRWVREVGSQRAGRLLDNEAGDDEDVESDAVARDVGIDGAGASAEEAAMHVIDDDPESWSGGHR